jgi:predicted nuclease with TOPRIM domain
MNIKEAAAAYGVSTQAIYQRIAKAGKKAKDLTNRETGDLTDDAEALLASWFASEPIKEGKSVCNHCKELQSEKDALQAELKALQAENQALQSQLALMQTDKDRLYTLLNQAQQMAQALTVARIGEQRRREARPLWERVRVFVMGEKADNMQE